MLTFAHNMLSMCAFALAYILDNSVTNRLRVYVYIYMVSRILEISLVTVFFFFFRKTKRTILYNLSYAGYTLPVVLPSFFAMYPSTFLTSTYPIIYPA